MPFPVIEVMPDQVIGDEQLGSKNKFWFLREKEWWLFKEARANTGEDWAEKIAAEVADLIGVEAAEVQLAQFQGKHGSASKSFMKAGYGLAHGNEVLAGQIIGYDRNKKLHQSDHTFENIVKAVHGLFSDLPARQVLLVDMAGYLVLDALICNTDRHHENWGLTWEAVFISKTERWLKISLAPSFDHASSLGRELRDEKRLDILRTNEIGRYVRGGRGGIYLHAEDKRGANPVHLVAWATEKFPNAFRPSLKRLAGVAPAELTGLVDELPEDRISQAGRDFAKALLSHTYRTLVELPT